jgi:hypothetical protein
VNAKIMSKLVVCALAVIAVAGCATSGGGSAKAVDESANVKMTLDKWKAAVEGQKTDEIMANYSESFSNADLGATKAAFRDTMNGFVEQGAFQGAKVGLDKTKVAIDAADKTKATAGPVDLQASFGGATLNFTLKKETDGMWRFVAMTVDQY